MLFMHFQDGDFFRRLSPFCTPIFFAFFAGLFKSFVILCVANERSGVMQKKLLTNGNAFKRTDGRWCGVIWYMNESGERKRKSFSVNATCR